MAEEYVESTRDQHAEKTRAAWLPWALLLIVVAVLAWLFWRYAEPSAPSGPSSTEVVLTAARVPDVLGMASEQAADMIERAGFVAKVDSAFSSEAQPGTVASQQPRGGAEQTRGTTVVIVVATEVGKATGTAESAHDDLDRVPNVVGLTELRATELLENGGYRILVDEGYSTAKAQGVIFRQSPDSGQYSPLGTAVEVYVSLGQPPPGKTQVPKVMGLTPGKAESAIEEAGLDPRSLVQWNDKVSGTVFQQNPAAGTLVPLGSKVFILSGE